MRIWKHNLEKAGTLDACCWTFGKNKEKVDGSSSFSRLQLHLGGSGGHFQTHPESLWIKNEVSVEPPKLFLLSHSFINVGFQAIPNRKKNEKIDLYRILDLEPNIPNYCCSSCDLLHSFLMFLHKKEITDPFENRTWPISPCRGAEISMMVPLPLLETMDKNLHLLTVLTFSGLETNCHHLQFDIAPV